MVYRIALVNGVVLTPYQEIPDGTVIIENGLIRDYGTASDVQIPDGTTMIDVHGRYISPGFIDLHTHGARGVDVMEASPNDLEGMAE